MIHKWAISMAITFMMRQLSKWQGSIDWAKVKADLAERVKAVVPGEWLDAEAVAIMSMLVDAVAAVLAANSVLEQIIKMIVDGKYQDAWAMLRELLLKHIKPVTAADKKLVACIEGCEVL
jgi:hypothetical protein